jgi:hypothetical protein
VSSQLNPPEPGLSPDVLAHMQWAIAQGDGTYSFDPATGETSRFDPATGETERLVPFAHRRPFAPRRLRRDAAPAPLTSPGRVLVAARAPRRNVRRARAQARAPGRSGDDEPPSDLSGWLARASLHMTAHERRRRRGWRPAT